MTRMTAEAVYEAMAELNRDLAPGSESLCWQEYLADTERNTPDGLEFWSAIARCDLSEAECLGDVSEAVRVEIETYLSE